ncbi:aminotransferase class IV [Stappia sp.]|uniref:aminotransferase class IV n=1 Tax=Stappia sp. TaxID=1870903 RepID=UPI0032D8DCC8
MTVEGRVVYWNGRFVPETEARVSIYDSALMFGDTVFEMTRSFNGVQFKLRAHLERLYAGLKILEFPPVMSIQKLEQACLDTIDANRHCFQPDDEHRLMINITRGLLGIYQDEVAIPNGPNVIIADFPLRWTVASMGELFEHGINAAIPAQRVIPARYLDPKIKNRSRLHYMMANIQVSRFAGERNWALLLDDSGFIAEGTGDNFFIVKNEKVITPRGHNILRGISRDYIIESLCPALGLDVEERDIEPYDVHGADEAFMTGTPFCMLPVTSLDGLAIGGGRPGPVYRRLLEAWGERVGLDIAQQIKRWARDAKPAGDAPTPYRFKATTETN